MGLALHFQPSGANPGSLVQNFVILSANVEAFQLFK